MICFFYSHRISAVQKLWFTSSARYKDASVGPALCPKIKLVLAQGIGEMT